MGNKPKWNEALSNAMRGQLGTTREVFTNANGSNVILEKTGDKWKKEQVGGSPPDEEEEDEPEDEEDDEEAEEVSEGQESVTSPTAPTPGATEQKPQSKKQPQKVKKVSIDKEFADLDWDEPGHQKNKSFFNGASNAKNEKIKNVYEEMKKQIDDQLQHYYKTGKFTVDPTVMMNKVFHDIMGKYGYKSIFNNWFKNVAQKRTWIKKAWEQWEKVNPANLTKKLTGKLTVQNIGKFLKLKPNTINKLTHVFKLGNLLKSIRANPVRFIMDAFAKTGAMSTDMTQLVGAFGSVDAGDLLSYVITLLIT